MLVLLHVLLHLTTALGDETMLCRVSIASACHAFHWNEAPRYLIRDRDRIYGSLVRRRLKAMGIRDRPIAPASPWQTDRWFFVQLYRWFPPSRVPP